MHPAAVQYQSVTVFSYFCAAWFRGFGRDTSSVWCVSRVVWPLGSLCLFKEAVTPHNKVKLSDFLCFDGNLDKFFIRCFHCSVSYSVTQSAHFTSQCSSGHHILNIISSVALTNHCDKLLIRTNENTYISLILLQRYLNVHSTALCMLPNVPFSTEHNGAWHYTYKALFPLFAQSWWRHQNKLL